MNQYDSGDLIRVRGAFTNRQLTDDEQATFDSAGTIPVGVGVDPTTVTFSTKDADETVTAYVYGTDPEVNKQAAGSYYIDVSVDTTGQWWYRWESTGTGQAATEVPFYVRSQFP